MDSGGLVVGDEIAVTIDVEARKAVSDDRTPILVGAGQLTQRDVEPERGARAGGHDGGRGAGRRPRTPAGTGVAPADRLARGRERLLLALRQRAPAAGRAARRAPVEELYTTVGGNTPQWLVNETAARIAAGQVRVALLAGAEAMRSRDARAARAAFSSTGSGGDGHADGGRRRRGRHERATRSRTGLMLPTAVYPLFENALRAPRGPLDRRAPAPRWARSAPGSRPWRRRTRTPGSARRARADEIATVTPSNRMIGFPYPKLMNAIIEVDQAAAVIMTSVGEARALGIPRDRWVYLRGGGQAHDHWFVTERVDYAELAGHPRGRPARRSTAAGIGIERVDHLDLYSCFPAPCRSGATCSASRPTIRGR